ncbi:MAG: hypothetical protein AAB019_08210 [Planctomycetota bacterium]
MKKLKLYLETSVWNFLFADDAPEKRDITKDFFSKVKTGDYEIYVSGLVLQEIESTGDVLKRKGLLEAISLYKPTLLTEERNVDLLAQRYIDQATIPKRFRDDALHIAYAVVNQMDVVVSWNLKHIVNIKTRREVNALNKLEGFSEIDIATAEEVISYEQE